jgi:hypothetical protein
MDRSVSGGGDFARFHFARNAGAKFPLGFAQVAVQLEPHPPTLGESKVAIKAESGVGMTPFGPPSPP